MGLTESIRSILGRPNIEYFDAKTGRPKTTVKTGEKKGFSAPGTFQRTLQQLQLYWNYYDSDNTVWAATNSLAFNTVMVGYDIISDNEEAKNVIEKWCKRVDLQTHLLDSVIYAVVFGDAFLEVIGNKKGEPSSLKTVDPKTMEIEYDKFGVVQYYMQSLGKRDKTGIPKLETERICHIKLFSMPDGPYGISMYKANLEAIQNKMKVDRALTNAIIRHGTSKLVFTVGSEKDGKLPPPAVLDAIESEVEDIDEKNEFIVPWNVTVQSIDENGIQGVDKYYDFAQTELIIGMICPEEALGMGKNTTNATSKTKAILYERMIRSFQQRIARTIEKQLFTRVLQSNGFDPEEVYVEIKFKNVTSEDDAMEAKWMGNLIRGFRSSTVKPFTINEVRKRFGERELDIPEANTILYGEFEIGGDKNEPGDAGMEEEPELDDVDENAKEEMKEELNEEE